MEPQNSLIVLYVFDGERVLVTYTLLAKVS